MEEKTSEPQQTAWSNSEENLLSLWSDRALVYSLLHAKASKMYHKTNLFFSIPIIILSTLSGSASLATQSYVPPSEQATAQMIIGVISIGTGILQTISNFFGFAQRSEAHKNVSVNWGELHRLIFTELSVEREKRKPCSDFVKHAKTLYDASLKQSPVLPTSVLKPMLTALPPALRLPEELGNVLHTLPVERMIENEEIVLAALTETP